MKNILNNQKGVALILATLLMSLMLFLSLYYLDFSISENQISKSQTLSEKTYYLAESGVSEMVWKLKNDNTYKTNFETNSSWAASFTRTNPFGTSSGSYSVSITNTSAAHGDIVATGTVVIAGKLSQRVIKASVYRAIGESVIGENAMFSDSSGGANNIDLDIKNSNVELRNGGLHSNKRIDITNNSEVEIDGDLTAVNNYKEQNSDVEFSSGHDAYDMHDTPTPSIIDMPAVDFNSASSTSLKNRATKIYTAAQFQNLLNSSSTIVLDGIIYVTGNSEIEVEKNNISLTIKGALVLEGSLEFDGDDDHGHNYSNVNLNITTSTIATVTPAGIFAIGDIELEGNINTNINGVLYSCDTIEIEDIPTSSTGFNINGAIVGKILEIKNCAEKIIITYNNDLVISSIGGTNLSPILTVDHWEEQY